MTAEATIRITGQADVSRMRSMVEELRKIADGVRSVNRETKASAGATVGAGAAPGARGAVPGHGADWAEWQAYNRANPVPWAPVSGMADEEAREHRAVAEQEMHEARAARETVRKRGSAASRAVRIGRSGLGYGMMGLGLLGLGSGAAGVSSWLFQSGQEHLEQSKSLKMLERLVDIGKDGKMSWQGFGHSLGFVNSQMASLASTLGEQVGQFEPSAWKKYAGFGRFYRLDPHANMATLGGIARYAGGEQNNVTGGFLARAAMQAKEIGMRGGRMGEHMQTLGGYAPAMYHATGSADESSILALGGLPGLIFKGEGSLGEAGRGEMGREFIGNVQQAMTGSAAARTMLLRAMGYGRPGGPGYIEAEKRLEAGLYGKQYGGKNFTQFMGGMKGLSRDEQAAAFKELNSSMPMWQIEKLVDFGRSDEFKKAEKLFSADNGISVEDKTRFEESLSSADRKVLENMGWGGLGKSGVSEGEWMDVKKEGQRAEQGADMAQTMRNINDTLMSLKNWFQGATGQKLGESMERMTAAIEKAAARLEKYGTSNEIRDAISYYFNPDVPVPHNDGVYDPIGGKIDPLVRLAELEEMKNKRKRAIEAGSQGDPP